MAFTNPLIWPMGQQRSQKRRKAPFEAKTVTIINELDRAVRKLGITEVRITTNRRVRVDGQLSMSSADTSDDPGIAVYFSRKGEDVCIAFDKFNDLWGNLRAVGLYLEYMARLENYDMTEIADRAFTGFTALPATAGEHHGPRAWHEVLGVAPDAPAEVRRAAYRALANSKHPDKGGSTADWLELQNAAKEAGL